MRKYTRRYRAGDGVVHNVVTVKEGTYPKNMTFCRLPAWRLDGRWMPPDALVTCVGCIGAVT